MKNIQPISITKKKVLLASFRIILPLYATYALFAFSIFVIFIPKLKMNMLEQKKTMIRELTESAISLLAEYDQRIKKGEIEPQKAKNDAKEQIRMLRYGPEGKDYFWINDMHPFMIMHPYRSDLEGRDLTLFKDAEGDYPFIAMVARVMQSESGYVNYYWQWKDTPEKISPKISYVKGFPPWGWILGTGIYTEDVDNEIDTILKELSTISIIILLIVLGISFYLTVQTVKSESQRLKSINNLLKSEKMHRKFIDNAPVAMYTINLKGEFTYINKKLEALTGYQRKDWLNKSFRPVVHPEDLSLVEQKIQQRIKGGRTSQPYEIRIFNSNGDIRWVKIISESIFEKKDQSENLIGVQSFIEDITRRKKAESDLRESEGRLKAILEANPNPMVFYDLSGYPQYLNPAFTKVFGWAMNELNGKRIPFIPEDQKQISREKIRQIFKAGYVASFETQRYTKEGKRIDVRINAALNTDNTGKTTGMVVNLEDITEKKAMEAQYIQAQKMEAIGTLAGGIAHDFNNILFPIIGYSEMLLTDLPKESPFRKSLNGIHISALRAKSLIKQILTFSRISTNNLKPTKLQLIIQEALKLVRATIPTTVEIKQDLRHDCGKVKADPTQIHQIIINLATNAYHAMQETGGELQVSLREIVLDDVDGLNPDIKPGKYACLTLADTGIGMDNNLTEKIFNPFFSTKEDGKGTGLGLSVVHGIVKNSGGSIQVYSEMGKGTKFEIYFPIVETASKEKEIQIREPTPGGTEQILLVDDDELLVSMEKEMLERLGYKVIAYTDCMEALDAFMGEPEKFDLIITDMAMPKMSGDKLALELSNIRPGIPILLCTGFSEIMSEKEALSLGINGFLMKPIIMADLSKKLRDLLDGSNPV